MLISHSSPRASSCKICAGVTNCNASEGENCGVQYLLVVTWRKIQLSIEDSTFRHRVGTPISEL